MTCIIGYIDRKNKKTYIGADSCASADSFKVERKDKKVFKPESNSNFVIGFTTSYRMGQLLMYSDIFPSERELYNNNEKVNHKYIVTKLIPKIKELFKDGNFGNDYEGGTFLIAYKDKLFVIYNDFQVEELNIDYNTAGGGYSISLGCLSGLEYSNESIVEKIHIALKTSSKFNTGVDKPYYIMNTEDDEVIEYLE